MLQTRCSDATSCARALLAAAATASARRGSPPRRRRRRGRSRARARPRAPSSLTARDALDRLLEGNRRFVAGTSRRLHTDRRWREEIAGGQHPFATIIGCADSRVPPELLFDPGVRRPLRGPRARPGGGRQPARRLPVCRPPPAHAALHGAGSRGLRGGAGRAAQARLGQLDEPRQLAALVRDIEPALMNLPMDLPDDELLHRAVEANVRHAVYRVMRASGTGVLGRMSEAIVGAVYDLKSGKVRLLV
ncbi:MAG: hypothetical protein MZV64_30000 [Ignavibacteriales bacterium]|nr:hypothetical protein [Ignavibacteriales bacterium]